MRLTELLLAGLGLWTLIGAASAAVAAIRGDRSKAVRSVLWVAGVWAVYLLVLLLVSWRQGGREIAMGEPQCFDDMCFAVQGMDEVEGFRVRGQEAARLVRVRVTVTNRGRGRPQAEAILSSYLLDGRGRRWGEVRGLSGVRLTARVAAGDVAVSEPVFRIPPDASGLRLVLTHGRWQPGALVIGDPDSWKHKPTVMLLEPRAAVR